MSASFPVDPPAPARVHPRPPAGGGNAALVPLPIPLLATKLFVPPPCPDLVARPRLEERLNAGLRRKLTLLAAPAGFGKTTVLSAWRAGPVGRDVPLAWVSLDADDNDPVRFWSYVGTALDAVHPGVGEPALALLHAPHPPPSEAVVAVLLNGLTSLPRDVALVLDDYHAIEAPPIHEALAFLLDHLPPTLHLIVATRIDPPLPLDRLRARGDLVEVRAADLRFTPDEAAAFLAEARRLSLTAEDIAALTARTEGWIAGLHLASLSLEGRENGADFVRAFAGSHRFLVDYLAEEVLSRQPPEVQAFLLQTAILDRLSGPLCDAVTDRHDGQAMLERLERGNLFTVPLDDERHWYRYHHLFAEFLRARLARTQPDQVATLHARAASWHEGEGAIAAAVGHALAGEDAERAARLLELVAEPMWMSGELMTLLGWLEALPPAVVRTRPRLALAHAGTHFLARSYDARTVEVLLAAAEAALDLDQGGGDEQAELRGTLAAIRAAAADAERDAPRAIASARLALEALPADRVFWRAMTTVVLGMSYAAVGDPAASQTLVEALALSQGAGNWSLAMVAMMNLAQVRAAEGRLGAAAELCRRGLAVVGEHAGGGLPVTVSLNVQLGKLGYEWNDLAAATRHLEEGLAGVRLADEQLTGQLEGLTALARVKQAQGDSDGADELLRRCTEVAQASQLPWAARFAAAYRARLDVHRDNFDAGLRWAEEAGLHPDDESSHAPEYEHLTLVRILIARGESDRALHLLRRQRATAATAGRVASELETLILEALARQRQGDEAGALTALEAALAIAEPEGYVRLFVDEGPLLAALLVRLRAEYRAARLDPRRAYVDRLLAAFGSPRRDVTPPVPAGRAPELPEPLTPREREVLALIADGLTNAEIAARLFVTVGTVKTYVNGIFGKLGATSRTQAVACARTVGLLSDRS